MTSLHSGGLKEGSLVSQIAMEPLSMPSQDVAVIRKLAGKRSELFHIMVLKGIIDTRVYLSIYLMMTN